MAHDGDNRRSRQFSGVTKLCRKLLRQLCFNAIVNGSHGGVAKFLDHQESGLLIDMLIHRRHNAQLHQRSNYLSRLNRQANRQVRHLNRFRYRHFDNLFRGRSFKGVLVINF